MVLLAPEVIISGFDSFSQNRKFVFFKAFSPGINQMWRSSNIYNCFITSSSLKKWLNFIAFPLVALFLYLAQTLKPYLIIFMPKRCPGLMVLHWERLTQASVQNAIVTRVESFPNMSSLNEDWYSDLSCWEQEIRKMLSEKIGMEN